MADPPADEAGPSGRPDDEITDSGGEITDSGGVAEGAPKAAGSQLIAASPPPPLLPSCREAGVGSSRAEARRALILGHPTPVAMVVRIFFLVIRILEL